MSVAGVWDDDPVRLAEAAARYGLRAFERPEDLLAACRAAAICSETAEHPRLVELCCRAGVHVLCEKPTAIDLSGCRKIKRLVEGAGIVFYQSFPQRHIPSNLRIKQLLAEGTLGRVTHVRKRHGHHYGLLGLDRQMPWIVDPSRAGGGALLDEGVHESYVLDWFFGQPLSVTAELAFHGSYPVESSGVALYRFPGDMLCTLEAGWNWWAGGPTTEIYGERGVILQYHTDCASNSDSRRWPHLCIYRAETTAWELLDLPWDFAAIHTLAPRDFVSVVIEGSAPPTGIDEGLRAMAMIEGAYRAARERRSVSFPLD